MSDNQLNPSNVGFLLKNILFCIFESLVKQIQIRKIHVLRNYSNIHAKNINFVKV